MPTCWLPWPGKVNATDIEALRGSHSVMAGTNHEQLGRVKVSGEW
jgi:hypothetical protein